MQDGVCPVCRELPVSLGGTGDVRVAGDDDAVGILRVLLIAQELYEHVDKLIEHGLALWLYLRGAKVEEHSLVEDDVAVVADADLALVAHDIDDAVAYLFKYRHTQHGDALHLGAHFKKLAVCGLEIFLLIADELFLVVYGLGLLTDLERVAIYLALLELEFLAQIVQLRLLTGAKTGPVGQV